MCLFLLQMTEAVEVMEVPIVVGSFVVVGSLTCCTLFHSICDLKAVQMNIEHSLI